MGAHCHHAVAISTKNNRTNIDVEERARWLMVGASMWRCVLSRPRRRSRMCLRWRQGAFGPMLVAVRLVALAVLAAATREEFLNVEGDLVIGAFFPIHRKGPDGERCGALQVLKTYMRAVDFIFECANVENCVCVRERASDENVR
jgi:hypothetical protein